MGLPAGLWDWEAVCVLLGVLGAAAASVLYVRRVSRIHVHSGRPPFGNITFAYKFKEGPYEHWEQVVVECRSIEYKVANIRVLYDDPKKPEGGRYAVGSILREGGGQSSEDLERRFQKAGFHVCSFPEVTHAVTTSCPHGTPLSALLGARRMYTRLEDYIKERRLCAHPYVEVYSGGRVQCMIPLARQGDFYVPELRQPERRISAGEDSGSESDVSDADSNSEYSSGSGVFLCDSRELSAEGRPSPPARSHSHSQSRERWERQENEHCRRRSSCTGTPCKSPNGEGPETGGSGEAHQVISAENDPENKHGGAAVVVDGEEGVSE